MLNFLLLHIQLFEYKFLYLNKPLSTPGTSSSMTYFFDKLCTNNLLIPYQYKPYIFLHTFQDWILTR